MSFFVHLEPQLGRDCILPEGDKCWPTEESKMVELLGKDLGLREISGELPGTLREGRIAVVQTIISC